MSHRLPPALWEAALAFGQTSSLSPDAVPAVLTGPGPTASQTQGLGLSETFPAKPSPTATHAAASR